MIETTAWEGTPAATFATTTNPTTIATDSKQTPQTTTHWHDGNKTDFYEPDNL